MIHLSSIYDCNKLEGNKILSFAIVRNYKEPVKGVQQFTRLAPSQTLYEWALQNNDGSPEFLETYHKAFQEELKMHDKQIGILLMEDLVKSGYTINLLCYCKDYNKCHRLDVYESLKSRGIECDIK